MSLIRARVERDVSRSLSTVPRSSTVPGNPRSAKSKITAFRGSDYPFCVERLHALEGLKETQYPAQMRVSNRGQLTQRLREDVN
jgi:hypothetical protein